MLPAKCAGRMGEQMIKSMTGFGRCEICEDNRKFTVEMKSVNHRYLDVNLKMPKKLNFFEAAIRNLLKEYIQRGKVDVFITYEDLGQEKVSIRYNKDVAAKYLDYLRQMSADFGLEDDTKLSSLARFPEVFSMEEEEPDEEGIWKTLEKALRSAAEGFVTARVREGEALKNDLCAKLDEMKGYVDFIEERSPQIVSEYRQKLTQRVQELLGDVKADESRLLTEVTVYADKICVDEEIVRLQSHISAMKKSLTDGGSIGRKLDFLAQEMNREANTILSKTTDLWDSDGRYGAVFAASGTDHGYVFQGQCNDPGRGSCTSDHQPRICGFRNQRCGFRCTGGPWGGNPILYHFLAALSGAYRSGCFHWKQDIRYYRCLGCVPGGRSADCSCLSRNFYSKIPGVFEETVKTFTYLTS